MLSRDPQGPLCRNAEIVNATTLDVRERKVADVAGFEFEIAYVYTGGGAPTTVTVNVENSVNGTDWDTVATSGPQTTSVTVFDATNAPTWGDMTGIGPYYRLVFAEGTPADTAATVTVYPIINRGGSRI